MAQALLSTPRLQLGPGSSGATCQGDRTMWLPSALLLLCLPGEWGWGLWELGIAGGRTVEG